MPTLTPSSAITPLVSVVSPDVTKPTVSSDGFIHGETNEIYHSTKAIGSHRLADFSRDPMTLAEWLEGRSKPIQNLHFAIGSAVHCRSLEGEAAYAREFSIGSFTSGRTLTVAHDQLTASMAASIRAHEGVRRLMDGGCPEVVSRWTDWATGIPCQARFDWLRLSHDDGFDLKTSSYLGAFAKAIRSYGYIEQVAFYRQAYFAKTQRNLSCPLVAVEKRNSSGPHRVMIVPLMQSEVESAVVVNRRRLDNMARWLDAHRYDLETLSPLSA